MPECAICRTPISGTMKFVLTGAEVVHRSCARTGRQTAGQLLEQEVQDLRVRLATAESMIASGLYKNRMVERQSERAARTSAAQARELAAVRRELEDAQAAAAAARRELELHLALARPAVAQPTPAAAPAAAQPLPPPTATDTTPERDAAEQRFALLEFA